MKNEERKNLSSSGIIADIKQLKGIKKKRLNPNLPLCRQTPCGEGGASACQKHVGDAPKCAAASRADKKMRQGKARSKRPRMQTSVQALA